MRRRTASSSSRLLARRLKNLDIESSAMRGPAGIKTLPQSQASQLGVYGPVSQGDNSG
jgi:hypothetical protein